MRTFQPNDKFIMVWLCMTTREVIVSESTLHRNLAQVAKQADLFVEQIANREEKPVIVMHVKHSKFPKGVGLATLFAQHPCDRSSAQHTITNVTARVLDAAAPRPATETVG